jgi:CPA1 family monovalent cation:H+ antiporter
MDILTIVTVLILLTAMFSWLNAKFLKLPGTIGVMTVAIVVSFIILITGKTLTGLGGTITNLTHSIDFSKVLLDVILGFLLFASALHFDFVKLREQRKAVFVLSTLGVVISTLIVGGLLVAFTHITHLDLPAIYCFTFGALISPTDPIAVAAILKKSRIPPALNTIISGESMFNDAVGIILFVTLAGIADTTTDTTFSLGHIAKDFGREVLGGVTIGLGLGFIGYRLMRSVRDFQTVLLLSIALVFAISLVATRFHASVPLAVVVAGLFIGNHDFGAGNRVHSYLVNIWKLLDEVLNTILFVMIGLQLVVLPFVSDHWITGLMAIAVLLIARFISVYIPAKLQMRRLSTGGLAILTWGGLRGGISMAMALSLPDSDYKETILAVTYIVVVFSIIGQGLTLGRIVDWAMRRVHDVRQEGKQRRLIGKEEEAVER